MNKWQIICPVTVFLLLLGLFSPFSTVLWKRYDVVRLAMFAHKIAHADRVVGTRIDKSVSAEIRGDDLPRVISEVSSAHPARSPLGTANACIFAVAATFYRGSNALDNIKMCGSLFLFHNGAPYEYGPGALKELLYTPVMNAAGGQ
jgi:hypothetical protein